MRVSATPPPRGQMSGRLAKMAGIFGMLVGALILVATATGIGKPHGVGGGDKSMGYMVGGLTAAYGLFRYLRGTNPGGRDSLRDRR